MKWVVTVGSVIEGGMWKLHDYEVDVGEDVDVEEIDEAALSLHYMKRPVGEIHNWVHHVECIEDRWPED
tara:strand:+ start:350 stop:556 length:207 start_codon:yes stop_codon:yes gene_type:complete